MIRTYILTDTSIERSKQLSKTIFKDNRFEVIIPNFEYLPENTPGLETKKVLNILINSKRETPDKAVLIVKDTSTTVINTNELANKLSNVLETEKFDLFYLCRWLDDCKKNPVLENDHMISIAKTEFSQGMQAILFSVEGRDKTIDFLKLEDSQELGEILYNKISRKKLDAICSIPNIFEFDLTQSKNPKEETYKNTLCKMEEPEKEEVIAVNVNYNKYYLIIIILLILYLIFKD